MSPYTLLCSSVLFPLHEHLKNHSSVAKRRSLERSQWLSPAELADAQLERLRTFLIEAKANTAYYRDLFARSGFEPSGIRSVQELAQLPLLDKALIRSQQERLLSTAHGRLVQFNTGGSSGEPLAFQVGMERISHDVAAKWRATRWWGVDIGDPELVVWGSPIELGTQDRLRRLRDGLMRSHLLPAFDMSESSLDRYVATIERYKPRMLFGYPSSLALIARHARERGRLLDQLGIKVAFVTSERLYDEQRDIIGQVFGCPVANGYGARDAGFIAHECPQGGMHVCSEDIVVEIVDSEGRQLPPGESGEIVVTHMATGDMPFIRYRTGDIAAYARNACSCGRGLPVLERIEGRSTDFVWAEDGTQMHGLALIYVLRELPGIRRFKIIQQSLELIDVQLVPEPHFDQALITEIEQGIRRRLGSGVTVRVTLVDEIAAERSGKYRYVVSHVVRP